MTERAYFETPPRVGTLAPGDNSEKAASTAYVDAAGGVGGDATSILGVDVDDANIGDGRVLVFRSASGNLEYEAQSGGAGSGVVVQVKNFQTGAVATGSTTIPLDDTIPQNTEGTELMTLAITPTDVSNKLRIEVAMFVACNAAFWCTTALFQDATANALAAVTHHEPQVHGAKNVILVHTMTAGTTSATTFKVRAGPHIAGGGNIITLNGNNGARFFGGVAAASITITEYVP